MNLKVPFNTSAKINISAEELKSLKVNGHAWEQFQKANKTAVITNSALVLGSGHYHIRYVKQD